MSKMQGIKVYGEGVYFVHDRAIILQITQHFAALMQNIIHHFCIIMDKMQGIKVYGEGVYFVHD